MYTRLHKWFSVGRLLCIVIMAALLLASRATRAQSILFGSLESPNSAVTANNLAIGFEALYSLSTGTGNLAISEFALYNNNSGNYNTAIGYGTLYYNTGGASNTACGVNALYNNTTGYFNTANGVNTLYSNTTGYYNTAIGFDTLTSNTTGANNAATGIYALFNNTTGNYNTANGTYALENNTTGDYNVANGTAALYYNTAGYSNIANGTAALYSNTTGYNNSATGINALEFNTTGANNSAIGYQALYNNSTGSNNVGIGYQSGYNITTGSNNIAIGNSGTSSDSGVIRIGSSNQTTTYIAGINGVTASKGVEVFINANGQLGTLTSSRRFKYDINNIGEVSDKLMQLRPVTFRYKQAAEDGSHPVQYGLIAEEVAKVYPNMVQYDKDGKPFTVYYQQLTPMMLNELQKAHQNIDDLKSTVQKQSDEFASLKQAQQRQSTLLFGVIATGLGGGALALLSKVLKPSRRRKEQHRPAETPAYAG